MMTTQADIVAPACVVGRINTPYGQVVRFVREPLRELPEPPRIDPEHDWVLRDAGIAATLLPGPQGRVHFARLDDEPVHDRPRTPVPAPSRPLAPVDLSDIVKGFDV